MSEEIKLNIDIDGARSSLPDIDTPKNKIGFGIVSIKIDRFDDSLCRMNSQGRRIKVSFLGIPVFVKFKSAY